MDSLARQSIELYLKITDFRGEDLDVIELGFEIVDLAGSGPAISAAFDAGFHARTLLSSAWKSICPQLGASPTGPAMILIGGFMSEAELRTRGARRIYV